jgi:hypothetical protein
MASRKFRICLICGVEYNLHQKDAGTKYCSEPCKKQALKVQVLACVNRFRLIHPDYVEKLNEKMREKTRLKGVKNG